MTVSETTVALLVKGIAPVNEAWRSTARAHLDTLTKPLGSLGRLEDIAAQVVAVREAAPVGPVAKGIYIFAADHGVTAEGVSAYPREVTRQMVLNFLAGGAAVNVLARLNHASLNVIDVGVDAEFNDAPGLFRRKICNGTSNMLREPPMTDAQLSEALMVGAEMAEHASAANLLLVAIGEMGIGNTTSASVITCALTGADPALATGVGTGIVPTAHVHKIEVVAAILKKHLLGAAPSPLDLLRCAGGLEIAAMTGMILACAQRRLIVLVDGFISTAAAALAVAIDPAVRGYLIAGHRSEEPGHRLLLDHLQLTPVLALRMRLGEGTGAVMAMSVVEAALALYNEMATFASASVSEATA